MYVYACMHACITILFCMVLSYNLYRPICVFLMGEVDADIFKTKNKKHVSDFKKDLLWSHEVRLYHHLDL